MHAFKIVVGQGDSFDAAVADLESALEFHRETFGMEQLDVNPPILDAFIARSHAP